MPSISLATALANVLMIPSKGNKKEKKKTKWREIYKGKDKLDQAGRQSTKPLINSYHLNICKLKGDAQVSVHCGQVLEVLATKSSP